jgi:hypothetical protein|nr:MAG TPA: hypothetical protein [Bacteriophage sp.]
MNKLIYQKNKNFCLFGKVIFKTSETYQEWFQENVSEETPPIQITQDYYNKEFNIDDNNNK